MSAERRVRIAWLVSWALFASGCAAHAEAGGRCRRASVCARASLEAGLRQEAEGQAADARASYARSCELGSWLGCRNLGVMLLSGNGGEADGPRALALLDASCDRGIALACDDRAVAFVLGAGGSEISEPRARELFERACAAGEAAACAHLGSALWRGELGFEADAVAAEPLLDHACRDGVAHACTDLGALLEDASHDDLVQARAAEAYGRGCEGGDPLGCANRGAMVEHGRGGLSADPRLAIELYRRACEAGEQVGCLSYGLHLERGTPPLTADPEAARESFERACDRGVGRACLLLAQRARAAADVGATFRAFARACEAGDELGCIGLADMVERGLGRPADPASARALLEAACDAGGRRACARLGR